MSKSKLHYCVKESQPTDGEKMLRKPNPPKTLYLFLSEIIREYAKNTGFSYELYISDLPLSIQKLLLAYVDDDFAWSCASVTRIESVIKEHKNYLQNLIDIECGYVFSEDMDDAGFKAFHHEDNNEVYWVKY